MCSLQLSATAITLELITGVVHRPWLSAVVSVGRSTPLVVSFSVFSKRSHRKAREVCENTISKMILPMTATAARRHCQLDVTRAAKILDRKTRLSIESREKSPFLNLSIERVIRRFHRNPRPASGKKLSKSFFSPISFAFNFKCAL